ncbi:DUF7662 domain-containing protein [Caulobacter sp. DWR2-3-1b2]|uniref:DUF7662 domain-containing protein n=1 Tax=unclassified Caulobacter TaxID=2648921 RepID=UPI0019A97174|nr:hypothetical protein [Caulobacter sp.]
MKYGPLKHHLEGLFPAVETRLDFADIERILGFGLPRSAYEHPAWWSNTRAGHSHAAAWLDAGWKTAALDRAARTVGFVKAEAAPAGVAEEQAAFLQDAPAMVTFPLAALGERALRMIDEHAKEHGGDRAGACVTLLNQLANDRLVAMVEWFQNASTPSTISGADLIREDRDSDER